MGSGSDTISLHLKVSLQPLLMRFIHSLILSSRAWIPFVSALVLAGPMASQSAPTAIVAERLVAADSPVGVRPASHATDETGLLILCHNGLVMWFDQTSG